MNQKTKHSEQNPTERSYYLDARKFIRDLVHGYVYLTDFDLKLIDTPEFQRLKDVRQLTCQHVYPSARHTRFEHSLGVMELTRHAVRKLNRNGIISRVGIRLPESGNPRKPILDELLQFNVALAALLHDIGHCPFSHMGETEFDKNEVLERLCKDIKECPNLAKTGLLAEAQGEKLPGAVHEQLSCIVILEKLYDELNHVSVSAQGEQPALFVDFELIIRCIIGMPYDTKKIDNKDAIERLQQKNVAVHLINSPIFDMDKLDYIMRDTLLTGIENPGIDTRRLFRNMYLNNEVDYSIAFSYRAVPALQNMIEARDNLYMYVYNHHAAVFSEFLYSYIFRRLEHNYREFTRLAKPLVQFKKIKGKRQKRKYLSKQPKPIIGLGAVPKSYLFSSDSILEHYHSDSDLISLLNKIYCELNQYTFPDDFADVSPNLEQAIRREIRTLRADWGYSGRMPLSLTDTEYIYRNLRRAYKLIEQYTSRTFLKPWWKTNFEFSDFIQRNFPDTRVQKTLCKWICHKSNQVPAGDEVRSQLAKHVIYITHELKKNDKWAKKLGLLDELGDGGFFVIERAPKFYEPEKIQKLDIILKYNTNLNRQKKTEVQASDYYIKELTQVIPQRDYYEMYPKEGFYIFSKPLIPQPEQNLDNGNTESSGNENIENLDNENAQNSDSEIGKKKEKEENMKHTLHYRLIEKIFVFVADWMVRLGEREFQRRFTELDPKKQKELEDDSKKEALKAFLKSNGIEIEK